ncbi:MAG: hypothetical protein IPG48_06930 [Saprospiraceae bacterium]|nr:hypothetical protein [Saprospiraceae bacterium]
METTKGAASVTAAAHLSGPYSLSGAMRDLILVKPNIVTLHTFPIPYLVLMKHMVFTIIYQRFLNKSTSLISLNIIKEVLVW